MGRTYVVFVGRKPGIYETWEETHVQVNKFSGVSHMSFRSREEAMKAFDKYTENCPTSSSSSFKGKSYVVFVGRKPGVYEIWEETHAQVNKFSGAFHMLFRNRDEACKTFDT